MFNAVVEDAFWIQGRGLLVVAQLLNGIEPALGATITLQTEGKPLALAQVRGYGTEIRPPRFGMLLSNVSEDAAKVGTHLSSLDNP